MASINRYLGDEEDVVLPLGIEAAAPLSVESSRPVGAVWLLGRIVAPA
ncbi:hypothetical protein [Nocardia terpenica]|uniref:Uncharacterized protein n=1 Tax=Nocardia terpenica TaxID=455432 RepID=A0A6G9ZDN7_9NOCA|nr:hypothetical protein [Nocardia terpenica]QIS23550.1 hypothetical protein F6W96_39985 [Nocardia terpenica]